MKLDRLSVDMDAKLKAKYRKVCKSMDIDMSRQTRYLIKQFILDVEPPHSVPKNRRLRRSL